MTDETAQDPAKTHLLELRAEHRRAASLSARAEVGRIEGEIGMLFDNHRQLEDGECVVEGVLFGAFFRSKGRMTPRQYRTPEHLAGYVGELVEKLFAGVEQYIAQDFGQERKN